MAIRSVRTCLGKATPPSQGNSRLLLISCLALLCVIVFQLVLQGGPRQKSREPAQPNEVVVEGLAVARSALDIGEVWEAKNFDHTLSIQNQTTGRIDIRDFALSCGCVDVVPKALTIAPGETAQVRLTVDLTEQRRLRDLGVAQRHFAVEITPIQKSSAWPPRGWTIHGLVKSRITLDKFEVSFGEAPIRGEDAPAQTMVATVHVPFRELEPRFDPKTLSVRLLPRQQNQTELLIALNPALPAGPFNSEVRLDLIDKNGERLPGVGFPVSGIMQNEIRLLPARIVLGSKPVGTTAEAHIVLQAPDNIKVVVEQIEIDDPAVDIRPDSTNGLPQSRTYLVRQKIAKTGDQVSQVRFTLRKANQTPTKVPVEICYRGERKTP